MTVFAFNEKGQSAAESRALPGDAEGKKLFILCAAGEVAGLMDTFGWDEDTIEECVDLDESVRYTAYDGYDFVSLIYAQAEEGRLSQREVNLFHGKNHLVVVLPDSPGAYLESIREYLRSASASAAAQRSPLTYLYLIFFDVLASDFSEMMERQEDEIEALSEAILTAPKREQLDQIGRLRKSSYALKKMLRALSYVGGNILLDENKLLDKTYNRLFRSIDTRLKKLYDFAESLYDLSNGLLQTYDSKFSAQMNETVNKLAAITLIFSPLTFLAGIYGMNFVHMPELQWPFGYPLVLCVMAAVGLGVFIVMKRMKWL